MSATAEAPAALTVGLVDTLISQRYKGGPPSPPVAVEDFAPRLDVFKARKKPRAVFNTRRRRRLARCRRRRRAAGASLAELASLTRPRRAAPWPGAQVNAVAEVYPVDVKLKIRGLAGHKPSRSAGRGKITRFTPESRRRLLFFARNTRDLWTGMLTLTYPGVYPKDGAEVKRHINAFCQWLRRRKVAYLWVLEFQRRGAPHFHFLVAGWLSKTECAQAWHAIAGQGDPRHLVAGTRIEALRNPDQVGAYVSEYAAKLEQKTVPEEYQNVGRFWGASRVLTKVLYRMDGLYRDAARALRPARAFYGSRCRGWGFKWRWKGRGFILREGAGWFKELLRQAVQIDRGVDIWREWDGEEPKRPKWSPPGDGAQFLLAGGIDPAGGQYRLVGDYRGDKRASGGERSVTTQEA